MKHHILFTYLLTYLLYLLTHFSPKSMVTGERQEYQPSILTLQDEICIDNKSFNHYTLCNECSSMFSLKSFSNNVFCLLKRHAASRLILFVFFIIIIIIIIILCSACGEEKKLNIYMYISAVDILHHNVPLRIDEIGLP